MGVHNTTGVINTLFICFGSLLALAIYRWYRARVGSDTGNTDNNDSERLLRPSAYYAVDISMVLNAMTRSGPGLTAFSRMQQCTPPMPTKKEVYSFMDSWSVSPA